MTDRRKVFVCNRSYHDYRKAERFGDLVFLTEGDLNKFDISFMMRTIQPILETSNRADFIIPTAFPTLVALATGMMVARHGVVRFLLFTRDDYIERAVSFDKYADADWRL